MIDPTLVALLQQMISEQQRQAAEIQRITAEQARHEAEAHTEQAKLGQQMLTLFENIQAWHDSF